MVEVEFRSKFRPGENRDRPIGGSVAETPFTIAFRNLMLEAGFDSQLSLSHALGEDNSSNASHWLTGKRFPSPEGVGKFLIVVDAKGIKKGNEKLELFLNVYGSELAKREVKNAASRFELGKKRKSINTPVSVWLENFCKERSNSFSGFFQQIGLNRTNVWDRGGFSLPLLEDIERGVRSAYGEKQADSFHDAIEREKEEKRKKGKEVRTYSVYGMKKRQRESEVPLYNGQQAANIIGTNRENIRLDRMRLGLKDHLLTMEDVNKLRDFRNNQEVQRGRAKKADSNEVQIFPLAS